MDWSLGIAAIVLLMVGLVGQAFEMRRIRTETSGNDMGSPNIFTDSRNFKWYGMIGLGIVVWYVAERL